MKAFLGAVSSLCFWAILLCFFAYTTDRLPISKTTQHTSVAAIPQQVEMQASAVTETPLCSPCVDRIAFMLEMIQGWEEDQGSRLETAHPEGGHVHEPSTVEGIEARGWAGLSPAQREKAKQFFDQYGTEEGLRRLREADPDAARQFKRERRERKMNTEP